MNAFPLFFIQKIHKRKFDRMHATMPGIQTQRPTVNRQSFDAEKLQPVSLKQWLERRDCKVEDVLVIYRIKLRMLYKIHRVRKLQRDAPARFEQCLESSDKIIG